MDAAHTLSRDEEMLAAIAERDFALACRVHDEAMAAERDQLAELSRAYQRATRSLRQTLALKARLARDADEAQRKAQRRAEAEHSARIHRKKNQVSVPLERAIWNEHEDNDCAEQALAHLNELLDDAALLDGFLDEPVEAIIARLAGTLGYEVEITSGGSPPAVPEPALAADTS